MSDCIDKEVDHEFRAEVGHLTERLKNLTEDLMREQFGQMTGMSICYMLGDNSRDIAEKMVPADELQRFEKRAAEAFAVYVTLEDYYKNDIVKDCEKFRRHQERE